MDKPYRRRDLLGIRNLSAAEIIGILDTAENFREISNREIKKVPTLRGKTVINLFFLVSWRREVYPVGGAAGRPSATHRCPAR